MGIFPKGARETSRHQEIRWCLPSSVPGPPPHSTTGMPLGHSSAGATRLMSSPRRCPSASNSHDAPTIPASDGGSLYIGYHSGSPMGRGQTIPSQVPTTKKGRRCRRCPRCRPGYGECWRLLHPEWQRRI